MFLLWRYTRNSMIFRGAASCGAHAGTTWVAVVGPGLLVFVVLGHTTPNMETMFFEDVLLFGDTVSSAGQQMPLRTM